MFDFLSIYDLSKKGLLQNELNGSGSSSLYFSVKIKKAGPKTCQIV
jgi:hypothetical protein